MSDLPDLGCCPIPGEWASLDPTAKQGWGQHSLEGCPSLNTFYRSNVCYVWLRQQFCMASRPQGISGKIQLASTSPGAGDPSLLPENAAKHPQQCTVDPEGISLHWVFVRCFLSLSRSVMSDSLRPHGLQHVRLPCPSPTPGACSNSCPSSRWCNSTISPSDIPFSSSLQSFQTSRSFPVSQFFTSGGQRTGASASLSVLPMNIQGWFPLEMTGLISLQPKEPSRVLSITTVQKHQFFCAQLSLRSNSHIHTWLLEIP